MPILFSVYVDDLLRKLDNLGCHMFGMCVGSLLYADDLVLLAGSREKLMEKICIWKEGLESKGLRVNVGKAKVMKCHVAANMQVESGKF